jgi:exosortase/archaeosortase family protein
MSTLFSKIQLSTQLKEEIFRYLIAFFLAWLASALISDFPFFSNPVKNSKITAGFQQYLILFSEKQVNLLGFETYKYHNSLKIMGSYGVRIDYGCLGFRHMAFFMVFIILQFGKSIHKIGYLIFGNLLFIFINTVRISSILIAQYYQGDSAQNVHDIASPILMYPTILFLWIFWVLKFGKPTENSFLILPRIKKTMTFLRLRKK